MFVENQETLFWFQLLGKVRLLFKFQLLGTNEGVVSDDDDDIAAAVVASGGGVVMKPVFFLPLKKSFCC